MHEMSHLISANCGFGLAEFICRDKKPLQFWL